MHRSMLLFIREVNLQMSCLLTERLLSFCGHFIESADLTLSVKQPQHHVEHAMLEIVFS